MTNTKTYSILLYWPDEDDEDAYFTDILEESDSLETIMEWWDYYKHDDLYDKEMEFISLFKGEENLEEHYLLDHQKPDFI